MFKTLLIAVIGGLNFFFLPFSFAASNCSPDINGTYQIEFDSVKRLNFWSYTLTLEFADKGETLSFDTTFHDDFRTKFLIKNLAVEGAYRYNINPQLFSYSCFSSPDACQNAVIKVSNVLMAAKTHPLVKKYNDWQNRENARVIDCAMERLAVFSRKIRLDIQQKRNLQD